MNLSKISRGFDVGEVTKDAMIILEDSRNFEIMLRTLKDEYIWSFGKPGSGNSVQRCGFPFKDGGNLDITRHQDTTDGRQTPIVDLVVSPSLYKRGNNDGTDYQTKSSCIKEVVCNASRFFPQTNTPVEERAGAPKVEAGSSDAVQAIKEEHADDIVMYAHSQMDPAPVGSVPAPEKHDFVAFQGDISGEVKIEAPAEDMVEALAGYKVETPASVPAQ